jgi:microcystin-dependent protein
MPDVTTPILDLTLPEVGGSADTWGAKLNANFSAIDAEIGDLRDKDTSSEARLDALEALVAKMIPAKCGIPYWGDVADIKAPWYVCNGQNGTPDLRGLFIIGWRVGVAGKSDIPPNSTGGSLTPTGLATAEAGDHNHGGKAGGTALTIAQMPAHNHGGSASHAHTLPGYTTGQVFTSGGGANDVVVAGSPALQTSNASLSISTEGAGQPHDHPITDGGKHTHQITGDVPLQPYYAMVYITRIDPPPATTVAGAAAVPGDGWMDND